MPTQKTAAAGLHDTVRALLEHAVCYPSSFNLQHCRFVLVTDKAGLAAAAPTFEGAHAGPVTLLLVLAGDPGAWQRVADYNAHLPLELSAMLADKAHHVYAGHERVQRDEAFRSMGLAAANLVHLAQAEGLQIRWLDCVDPAALAHAIALPPKHVIGYCLAIEAGPETVAQDHGTRAPMYSNRYLHQHPRASA